MIFCIADFKIFRKNIFVTLEKGLKRAKYLAQTWMMGLKAYMN